MEAFKKASGEMGMKKAEIIVRYGEGVYKKQLEWNRQWEKANPDKVKERDHNKSRKGGRYYKKMLKDATTGIPGDHRCNPNIGWGYNIIGRERN